MNEPCPRCSGTGWSNDSGAVYVPPAVFDRFQKLLQYGDPMNGKLLPLTECWRLANMQETP